MINIKDFEPSLLKIDKKSFNDIGILQLKKFMIMKIFTV